MARVGFKMRLKAGNEALYKQRHDDIWPALADLLHDRGLRNYSIFRDGLTLFAYVEVDDPAALQSLPREAVMQKWWRSMEPLMECNPDASPVVTPLEEVFHLD